MNPTDQPVQPQRIVVNPADTKAHVCKCGCEVFTEGFLLRKLSIFLGGDNQLKRLRTVYCVKCFTPVPDFLPPELRPVTEV